MSFSSEQDPQTSFLSLPNGCLCCSILEPGITAIENMVAQRPEGEKEVDWVVVELTGVADPAEIAKSFWTNEEMGGMLRLDGVVCVVDTKNIIQQLEEDEKANSGNECARQIAASDVILLNKTDLVQDESAFQQIEQRIAEINPISLFRRTHRSAVDLSNIFGIGGYSTNESSENGTKGKAHIPASIQAIAEQRTHEATTDHAHSHQHVDSSKKHLNGIGSYVFDLPVLSKAQLDSVETFLQALHWKNRIEGVQSGKANDEQVDERSRLVVLRSKGLFVDTEGDVHVLQGVRDIYELNKLDVKADDLEEEHPGSKLVVIGRNLGSRDVWLKGLRMTCGLD
ncbi:hypothetical protein QFC21_002379 [Naganishia friedmannii]|uniref:Uncharacterized protein n=1 Tax=Naganishia friedmannii TaxID=89922 RepID=A0ACC2VZ66_9TREE|nr:hypothetical protein QFC21_002379 [Naganishia friedmannii]